MGTRTDLTGQCDAARQEMVATRHRIEQKAEALKARMSAKELAKPWIDPLRERLGGGGEKIIEAFRDHPVPLALVGVGLGWMLIRDARGPREASGPSFGEKASDKVHDLKESVGQSADAVQEKAQRVKESLGRSASRVKEAGRSGATAVSDWFGNTLDENPWLLAVGAAAVGAALGLSFPLTEWEKDKAGKAAERLAAAAIDKGKETIEATGNRGGEQPAPPQTSQAPHDDPTVIPDA